MLQNRDGAQWRKSVLHLAGSALHKETHCCLLVQNESPCSHQPAQVWCAPVGSPGVASNE